jgi:hypothetical protein
MMQARNVHGFLQTSRFSILLICTTLLVVSGIFWVWASQDKVDAFTTCLACVEFEQPSQITRCQAEQSHDAPMASAPQPIPLEHWMLPENAAKSSSTPALYLASFGNRDKYYPQQVRSCRSAIEHGVQRCFVYRSESIDTEFLTMNKELFAAGSRGYGYWAWKPYVILAALESLNEGDVLIYSDVDSIFVHDLKVLYDMAIKNDILLFQDRRPYPRTSFIKRDALVILNAEHPKYIEGPQVWAALSVWRKNWRTKRFVNEWLTYMLDHRVSTDSPNELGLPNHDGFIENRHDQSTLDVLSIRWGIKHLPCPIYKSEYWSTPLIINR